jgi:hypothetical protein
MDGTQRIGQGAVVTLNPDTWAIAGLGDFNADRSCDILWHNQVTGVAYLYLMDGTQRIGQGAVVTLSPNTWAVAGVGDFNADRRSDILWQHLGNGLAYVHLMDGTQRIGQGVVGNMGLGYTVPGLGDFDGPE